MTRGSAMPIHYQRQSTILHPSALPPFPFLSSHTRPAPAAVHPEPLTRVLPDEGLERRGRLSGRAESTCTPASRGRLEHVEHLDDVNAARLATERDDDERRAGRRRERRGSSISQRAGAEEVHEDPVRIELRDLVDEHRDRPAPL